ncbi:MAG: DNRLRE domain-containing protein, partial [bacterium]|nr:DNRLRE domain-containing protein [bacterium]
GNLTICDFPFHVLLGDDPHHVTIPTPGDTYLRNGSRNQNQGEATFLRIRQSGKNRTLVRFPQEVIEQVTDAGSLVSATLELYIESNADNWGTDGRFVEVHRVSEDWEELAATWNCGIDADAGNSKPDCDPEWDGASFVATASASLLHERDLMGWIQFDLTADVRAFLSGGENFGWIVKKANEGASGKVEYTSKEGTPGQQPRL